MERLDKGLLDFGILIEPADMKSMIISAFLPPTYLGTIMPMTAFWPPTISSGRRISGSCLYILPTDYGQQRILGWLEKRLGDKLNIVATYNLCIQCLPMVEREAGIRPVSGQAGEHLRRQPLCFRQLKSKMDAHLDIGLEKYQASFRSRRTVFLKCAGRFSYSSI